MFYHGANPDREDRSGPCVRRLQNTVAEIEKSLSLLGQRLDVETAQHRLEEFNARVEDPKLWDDPEAAQKLMRDRQMLVDAIDNYNGSRPNSATMSN